MAQKFYIVYSEPKEKNYYNGRQRSFTKSDVCWFGIDQRIALQTFRSLARRCGNDIPHIKCLDLDEIPDFENKSRSDEMIASIDKKVARRLNNLSQHFLQTRAITTKDGSVTFSFTKRDVEAAQSNPYHEESKSVIHKSEANLYWVEEESFNKVFEILLDKYMDEVEVIVPTKVNISGKTYKKYQPTTNEN